MNCEELIRYLSDYIDNNLEESLRADAEEHLRSCHNCHIVLDTTQKTILLYRENGRQQIPLDRKSVLYERLKTVLPRKEDCPPDKNKT